VPIYLPPISRRRFLAGSIAAAALSLIPGYAASPSKRDANAIALFSDIHISSDALKLSRGVNMTNNLKAVAAEVLALPQQPGAVFVNGDMAYNNGESADYRAALGLLRPLREAGLPIHLNMGNHDDRERFWAVFQDAKTVPAKLPGRQAAIVRQGGTNWFLLDSLIKTRTTPGCLGEAQRAWLANALDANADRPAVVMLHHQPGSLVSYHEWNGLEDISELFAILRPRRQVKAYFFGHTHHWSVKQDESGIHLINLPTSAYVFSEGVANGWVHATLRDGGVRLELRCLDKTHPDNGHIADLAWRA
jgi:Icc-related predicted phosphoesterase